MQANNKQTNKQGATVVMYVVYTHKLYMSAIKINVKHVFDHTEILDTSK